LIHGCRPRKVDPQFYRHFSLFAANLIAQLAMLKMMQQGAALTPNALRAEQQSIAPRSARGTV
jgi:hypothetical protein